MKLLLDTHILLWWLDSSSKLSKKAIDLIAQQDNLVFVSAVSVWEIRIKEALKKIELPANFEEVLENEPFERLSISMSHTHALKTLPPHHTDPFDRMLVAQAKLDDLVLVTHDEMIKGYDVSFELV